MSEQSVAGLVLARLGDPNPGIVAGERTWPWDDVVRESCVRAGIFSSLLAGEEPPHIGVLLPNVPDYVFALFGAALAGVTIVGLNSTRRGAELARDVTHTECRVVLTDAQGCTALQGLDLGGAVILDVDGAEWSGLLATHAGTPAPAELPSATTRFLLIFTSGSTSAPKAVIRSQGSVARGANLGFRPGKDVLYCAMPLFHGNALASNLIPGLAAGATVVLREKFSASGFLPDVRRHGVTFVNTVGRALGHILATPPSPHDGDHRLRVVLAPEASPRDTLAFRERFHTMVISGYGSSEGGIVLLPGGGPGALGRAPEGVDIAVVDPETGEECERAVFDGGGVLLNAVAATGQLVRRDSSGGFEGYWNNPEADAERLRSGWFWSGDLAYRDADDVFWFAGRVGDWLRVDSENFAAAPVERVLNRWPGAAAAVVYPVPDVRTGDQVMAALELLPDLPFDPAAFADFLAAQTDLHVKAVPRFVRIVATMPVTGNDKVTKQPLQAEGLDTQDPLWWRASRGADYTPFTAADRGAWETERRAHRG